MTIDPQGREEVRTVKAARLFLFGNISPDWMPFCISITRSGISKEGKYQKWKQEIEGLIIQQVLKAEKTRKLFKPWRTK